MEASTPTISVVDDDESIRKALRRLVRSAGLCVATFASAEEFLACEGEEAACLILDVRLPGMSGLDLQRHLASAGRCVPIIFISARDDEQTSQAALAAGALAFLAKPFDDRLLLDAVARALEKGEAEHPNP